MKKMGVTASFFRKSYENDVKILLTRPEECSLALCPTHCHDKKIKKSHMRVFSIFTIL